MRNQIRIFSLFATLLLLGCGAPSDDINNKMGRQQRIFEANKALSHGECDKALTLVDPIYNSSHSDTEVRLVRASAYGCKANINFFKNATDIVEAGGSGGFSAASLWKTTCKVFPSTTGDGIVESDQYALDTLLTAIKPGTMVADYNSLNLGTHNPGSYYAMDREADANVFMFLVNMAGIGGIQNRSGAPDGDCNQTVDLPWITGLLMDSTGCFLAASILHLFDSIGAISSLYTGNTKTAFDSIAALSAGADAACALGCTACGVAHPASAAALACTSCPVTLKNRNSCSADTGAGVPNKDACAAAGIVANAVNLVW